MNEEVSLSQEQAELVEVAVGPAVEMLMSTGEFLPTLYLHDCGEIRFYVLGRHEREALREMVRVVVDRKSPTAVAYVLIYGGEYGTPAGSQAAAVFETGDVEEPAAVMLARGYSREHRTIKPQLVRLGEAPHLLR